MGRNEIGWVLCPAHQRVRRFRRRADELANNRIVHRLFIFSGVKREVYK